MQPARMHPKDRDVLQQLFGSGSAVIEQGVAAAQTPIGEKVVKVATYASAALALAVLLGSVDVRS